MVLTFEVMNSAASTGAGRDGTSSAGGNESVAPSAKRDLEHASRHGWELGLEGESHKTENKMFLMSGVVGFCVVTKMSSTLNLNSETARW
jgi:hypothetical protein